MMNRVLKYSRQREALFDLLKSVKTHPTAEWLYNELKKEYSNLSLATVYRNLSLLCEMGNIIKIDVGDGVEHYDATVNEHSHFICRECNLLIDVDLPVAKDLNNEAEKFNDIKVETNSLVFYGLCSKCK